MAGRSIPSPLPGAPTARYLSPNHSLHTPTFGVSLLFSSLRGPPVHSCNWRPADSFFVATDERDGGLLSHKPPMAEVADHGHGMIRDDHQFSFCGRVVHFISDTSTEKYVIGSNTR